MADPPRLSARPRRRWLALIVLVLLAHLLAIDWIGDQLQRASLLPKMVEPMFTRLLQQQAPPQQVAAAPPVLAPVLRPQVRSIRAETAAVPARAASQPKPPQESGTQIPVPATAALADDLASAEAASTAAAASAPVASAPQAAASAVGASPSVPASAAAAPTLPASAAAPVLAAASAASAASAAAAPASAAAAPAIGLALDGWPTDTRLNYRLGGNYRGRLHGSARVQWLRQQRRYETRIDIDIPLLTSLALTSQGMVTAQGLKPEVYEELRSSGVRRATMREDSILLGNGKTVPRPQRVQDTASQFVELSHRFASGEDVLEVGRSVGLWLARPGGVDRWIYDIVGRDTLQTPELGTVEAYHLIPRMIDKPRGKITAEIWYAPSLQYLPVRIKVNMGSDTYVDLIVLDIQQR